MEKLRVSKSLVLDWWKYKEQEFCGNLFKLKYIDRRADEMEDYTNDSMRAGNRFEYQTLGSLSRSGGVPPIVTGANGKPLQIQQVIDVQTDRFLQFIKENNIEVVKSAVKLEIPHNDYILVCVIDGFITFDGDLAILEEKFTSMLNNDKSSFQFKSKYAYDIENLGKSPIHMIQPVLYTYIVENHPDYKVRLPFYYYIASSKQLYNSEFIEVEVGDDAINKTLADIDNIVSEIMGMVNLELEFEVYSDANKCSKCEARYICDKKIVSPGIRRVIA